MSASRRRQLPYYTTIRRDLEASIFSGRWPPGRRIPSEHELAARYGCARMTVNKALCQLAAAGLIVRHRRAGSFVAKPNVEESILEIHDIEAEARREGKPYRFMLAACEVRAATAADAERLGVPFGGPVVALRSVHHVDGVPFAHEDRLISLASVPDAREADFAAVPPGSWLLARVPWSRARHRISAVGADPAVARSLRIARGAACLVVERTTWLVEEPVTQVRLTYPGTRHQLLAHFSPARGNR